LAALYPSPEQVLCVEEAGVSMDMLGPHCGGDSKARLSWTLVKN